jgi:hypothetical protein
MTPQEQQLVADLFDRLASLEGQRRDPDAERVIRDGLGRAPNAVYALVQSVLVQDEALKHANARIEELEKANAAPAQSSGGGFLDSMRNVLTGRDTQRGSVPSVRPGGQGTSGVWGSQPSAAPPPQPAPQAYPGGSPYAGGGYGGGPMAGGMMGGGMVGGGMGGPGFGGGGSFLGTAAATVAGVVGGAMLLNGIRSAFGGEGHHQAFGDYERVAGPSPWDSGSNSHSDLARDAGVGDIGSGQHAAAYEDPGQGQGFFDNSDNDDGGGGDQAYDDSGGYDDGGDSDTV